MIVCNASNRHAAAMRHMNEGREQLSHGEFLTRVSPSRISDAHSKRCVCAYEHAYDVYMMSMRMRMSAFSSFCVVVALSPC